MDIISKLDKAPNELFDWTVGCTEEGFIPSSEDVMDEFGDTKWAQAFPDVRIELVGEVEDESFGLQTPDEQLRDRGMSIKDFI